MKSTIVVCLVWSALVLVQLGAISAEPTLLDKLELSYLSGLRVEVRHLEQPLQCRLIWRGVSHKLSLQGMEQSLASSLGSMAPKPVLSELAKQLRTRRSFQSMADLMNECASLLENETPEQLASLPMSIPVSDDATNEAAEISIKETGSQTGLDKQELEKTHHSNVPSAEQEEVKNLQVELQRSLASVDESRGQMRMLQQSLSDCNAAREQLLMSNQNLVASHEQAKEAAARLAEMQARLAAEAARTAGAEQERNLLISHRRRLEENESLMKAQAQSERSRSEEQIVKLQARVNELIEQLAQARKSSSKNEAPVRQLAGRIAVLESDLASKQAEVYKLEASLSSANQRIAQLKEHFKGVTAGPVRQVNRCGYQSNCRYGYGN